MRGCLVPDCWVMTRPCMVKCQACCGPRRSPKCIGLHTCTLVRRKSSTCPASPRIIFSRDERHVHRATFRMILCLIKPLRASCKGDRNRGGKFKSTRLHKLNTLNLLDISRNGPPDPYNKSHNSQGQNRSQKCTTTSS
jgi:hypothetical protein